MSPLTIYPLPHHDHDRLLLHAFASAAYAARTGLPSFLLQLRLLPLLLLLLLLLGSHGGGLHSHDEDMLHHHCIINRKTQEWRLWPCNGDIEAIYHDDSCEVSDDDGDSHVGSDTHHGRGNAAISEEDDDGDDGMLIQQDDSCWQLDFLYVHRNSCPALIVDFFFLIGSSGMQPSDLTSSC